MVEVTQEDRDAAAELLTECLGLHWNSAARIAPEHLARHRIAAENAAQEEITALRARIAEDQAQIAALTTYRENLRDEVVELRARIEELEARLEIDPAHSYDGIAARDATIEGLQAQIAEIEADRAQWVEVERLRMGKLFGWHEPTWRKVAKWANREWHEYTGPDHVKARLLLRQQWLDAGGSMDGEKAPPTPPA